VQLEVEVGRLAFADCGWVDSSAAEMGMMPPPPKESKKKGQEHSTHSCFWQKASQICGTGVASGTPVEALPLHHVRLIFRAPAANFWAHEERLCLRRCDAAPMPRCRCRLDDGVAICGHAPQPRLLRHRQSKEGRRQGQVTLCARAGRDPGGAFLASLGHIMDPGVF
jgi:hypothetical protein